MCKNNASVLISVLLLPIFHQLSLNRLAANLACPTLIFHKNLSLTNLAFVSWCYVSNTNMVCKNKPYFCFEILVPELTHTNLFKVETWDLNLSWRTSNVLWLFSISSAVSIICIPSVQIKLIQFVLSEFSFYGGMFCIFAKFAFLYFRPTLPRIFWRPTCGIARSWRPKLRHLWHSRSSGRVEQKLKYDHFAKCFPIIRNFLQKLYNNLKRCLQKFLKFNFISVV